jgi:integrase
LRTAKVLTSSLLRTKKTLQKSFIRLIFAATFGDGNPKIVSEMLGHATIAITLDTYSHVLPDMQEKAALALEEALS